MSPIVGYHATVTRCREGIERYGLQRNKPTDGRPYGVYIFREDGEFNHPCYNSRVHWSSGHTSDLWEVAYIGPIVADHYVLNGLVLLAEVTHVTRVTARDNRRASR